MDDLISRAGAIKAFAGKPPEYYSTGYICNVLNELPAVDVIPVEWLQRKRKEALQEGMRPDEVEAVEMVLWMWQKEQEAR